MGKELFSETTDPISHLVRNIGRGEIALPELQRPFVWSAAQVRDLFDSLLKGFPIGSLLFWETGADSSARQIGTGSKERSPRFLVVDGQQRLTALYAVLTGEHVVRKDFSRGPIRIAFRPKDETFAVADAATDNDPEFLPDISALWNESEPREVEHKFLTRLAARRPLDQSESSRLGVALSRVQLLSGYQFRIVELNEAVDAEQVAEIFVRINNNGVQLKQADFILTLMSVHWQQGRRDLEAFCDAARQPSLTGASPFNWHIEPEPDQLLRVTTAVALRRAVLKQVYAVLRGRDVETGEHSPSLRQERFERLEATQKQVLDLTNWHEFLQCLERAGFRGGAMISSENAVVFSYVMWLLGRVEYGVPVDRLREVIARWFFMAQLTGRYSGSFETQVEQDFNKLQGVPAGDADMYVAALGRIVDDTLTPDFWRIALPNRLDASSARPPAWLAYTAALNILDADTLLSTTKIRSRLDPAILLRKGVERHHLFPRNHLKKQGVREIQKINQVANMALVDWNINIKISDSPPSEYWPRQLAAAPLGADRLARQRYWHALPEGWETMPYDDFLPARRKLIAEVVRDAFAKLGDADYAPEYPEPTRAVPAQRASENTWVTVADLLTSGLLTPGTRLTPKPSSHRAEAHVNADGNIVLDGVEYETPSPAAQAVIGGGHRGGWGFWIAHLPDEGPVLLDELRARYRALGQQ
ncbi:DUF262 domain-containing protein [Yinghuangia sp. ASG 101]|uniref:GmrSD restriction endonuclease domain-containing protein n=1 Tax=Yinghuangia sp. ASG 101 TaxID=2896848 RepID=UPI001E314035|nr:DUF262 domain-containing protein [Yinghuangia sp. ASG 101]UGQ12318.1 DUF262 domain-containing protein [Yinghuangia sp. ASG 101]